MTKPAESKTTLYAIDLSRGIVMTDSGVYQRRGEIIMKDKSQTTKDKEIVRLKRLLRKIDLHAVEGQNGSAAYAQDRLIQIRRVADRGI